MNELYIVSSSIASLPELDQNDDIEHSNTLSSYQQVQSLARALYTRSIWFDLPDSIGSYHGSPDLPDARYLQHSSHIPRAESDSYNYGSKSIDVLFLQATLSITEEELKSKMSDYDKSWKSARSQDQNEAELVYYPYIRNGRFQPKSILAFIERLHDRKHNDRAATILIDPETFDDTCIVIQTDRSCYRIGSEISLNSLSISTASVSLRIAYPLASLLVNDDHSHSLSGVLGSDFEESKAFFDLTSYPTIPDFPSDHSMHSSSIQRLAERLAETYGEQRLTVLSLKQLSQEKTELLRQRMLKSQSDPKMTVDIVDWPFEDNTRADVYLLFEAMQRSNWNSLKDCGYAFFIDYIEQDQDGEPQILAAWKTTDHGHVMKEDMSLTPIRAERVIDLWLSAQAGYRIEQAFQHLGTWKEHGTTTAQYGEPRGEMFFVERVSNPRNHIPNKGDEWRQAPIVWFLRDFNIDEQRRIRRSFMSSRDSLFPIVEIGLVGYIFPDNAMHTIDDLIAAFQKGDQHSPSFDASYSDWRFDGYPKHFLAVDDRIFDDNDPRVILATTSGFCHRTNMLGYMVGTVRPGDAESTWSSLDQARSEAQSCMMEAPRRIWLEDMTEFAKQNETYEELGFV